MSANEGGKQTPVEPAPTSGDREAFKREILAALDKEFVKKEIIEELGSARREPPATPTRSILATGAKFLQHPAVMLFLGFLLTGVIGSALTTAWQDASWVNQQTLLARQRTLDQKYELAHSVAKAVGETHTAPTGILLFFMQEDTPQNRKVELPKRLEYWRQTHREWLVNNNVLLQKITVHVADPEARAIFQKIVNKRKVVNNHIFNLLSMMREYDLMREEEKAALGEYPSLENAEQIEVFNDKVDDLEARLEKSGGTAVARSEVAKLRRELTLRKIRLFEDESLLQLREADALSKELMEIMADEIRLESNPPTPAGIWWRLWTTVGFGRADSPAPRRERGNKSNQNGSSNENRDQNDNR